MGKPRINGCDEDGKALYEERPFRATRENGKHQSSGWEVHCKRCLTITLSRVRLPHDLATAHECLYNPEEITDAAS
jgi:hypothetical protein